MTHPARALRMLVLLAAGACSPSARPRAPARVVAAPPESALAVGESIYYRGQYDSARTLWAGALDRARAVPDSAAEARLLTWLGLVAWRQGAYAASRQLGEQALALKQRLHLTHDLFKSYNALGLLAWNEARLHDAIALFDSAAAAARAANDTRGLAAVSSNLALVHTDLGEFAAARAGFTAARDGGRRLGDARVEGNALTNLGMLDIRSGDPSRAVAELQEARGRYRTIHYATGEQNALGQLGTAYDALGEPRLALTALDSALAEARGQGLQQDEASDLEALARLHQEAGDGRGALALYAEAKVINARLGLNDETGADLRNEAEIHAALGDLDIAERDVVAARAIHRRLDAHVEELGDLLLLADVVDRAGRRAAGRTHIAAARRMAARLHVRSARVDVALAEARIADRAGDAHGVVRALTGARVDLSQGGYDTEWESAALLCRAYARLDQLDAAIEAGRQAVAAVERVRTNYNSGVLRTGYLAGRAAAYADLVLALVRRQRLDDAFAVSDAARGRALLEHSPAVPDSGPALTQQEALLRRIDHLSWESDSLERVSGSDSAARPAIATFSQLLRQARGEYEALAVREEEARAPVAGLLRSVAFRAGELRAGLTPDEALVEYLVARDRVLIFLVTPDRVRLFTSPVTDENLVSRVRLARSLLAQGGDSGRSESAVLAGLYDLLITPAERTGALRSARSLTIVPQGVLTYLPFAALRVGPKGPYLIQRYALTYLPSAAALIALRARSPRATSASLGGVTALALAPDPAGLPATRGEVLAVSRALPRARWIAGSGATERRLREALATVPVVHVAAHGVLNAANPMFSRIELALGSRASDDDGRLEVHELLGLRVASALVFLSGCETDLGAARASAFASGEDYATLARAFLYAGARDVVATLWRVEDDGAAAFADRFYRHLRSAPPAEALAAAQREMIADPRYDAPYHWAAYRLTGAGRLPLYGATTADVSLR